MDPQLTLVLSQLLTTLKDLGNKVSTGIPARSPGGIDPLIIQGLANAAETEKAETWGQAIGIGRFFPTGDTSGTFIPPLLASLKELFDDVFLHQLPEKLALAIKGTLGDGVSGSFNLSGGLAGEFTDIILPAVGDSILNLSKSLAIAAVGFAIFSQVSWIDVVYGVAALSGIFIALVKFNENINTIKPVADELLVIGQALGYISLSFIAFSLTPWYTIFAPLITLGVILTMLVIYSKRVEEGKDVVAGIVDIGKALGLVALSFIAFSLISFGGFAAGILALGALVGAVALLGKYSDDVSAGADILYTISKAFLLSSIGFLVFEFIDPEAFIMGIVAIGVLVAGVVGLSRIKTQATVGAGLLLALSASFLIFSIGASFIEGVNWEILTIAVLGIGLLAAAAAFMGTTAPLILIGAGLIVVLGGALALFALTLQSLAGMESAGLPELGTNIGAFLSNLSSGISLGTLALPLVAVGLALVGPGIAMLINAVEPILGLNTNVLPEIGTNIGKFLTNLNENITVSTLGFLPGISIGLLGLGAALLTFGKFIPILITLPTGGLISFGGAMGKFLGALTQSIDLATIRRTRDLIPLLTDISPVLTKLSESVQRFGQIETNLLPLKAKDISAFFQNLNIDTGWFGDADEKLDALKEFGVVLSGLKSPDQSFSEFINAFSSLGDVKINVDVLSSETKKTNEILQTSVSIQNQQLNELKQQTSLLSKLQIPVPITGNNQPQPYPSGANSIMGTREQYSSSSYFIKSR
jgi:hypothetical protein